MSWDWLFLQPIHLLAILINSYYCCIMQVVSKVWRSVWFLMIVEFLTALFIFGIFSLNFFFSVPLLFCILPRPSSKAQRSKWRCGFWKFWWYMQSTFFSCYFDCSAREFICLHFFILCHRGSLKKGSSSNSGEENKGIPTVVSVRLQAI